MKPLPLADWDASLRHIADDMRNRPLNVHALMANHPRLLNAWWDLRNYLVEGGDLSQRHCELAILRVAVRLRSWYEWASHVDRGMAAGLSREEIEAVRRSDFEPLEAAEQALLKAVDELLDTHRIDQAALMDYFSAQQIMDLIALCGMYVTLGGMIGTWGLDLDAHVQDRLPDGINEQEFAK